VLLANPDFDEELAVTAQVAISDLPAESSGGFSGNRQNKIT
jgi:hypothetical protein